MAIFDRGEERENKALFTHSLVFVFERFPIWIRLSEIIFSCLLVRNLSWNADLTQYLFLRGPIRGGHILRLALEFALSRRCTASKIGISCSARLRLAVYRDSKASKMAKSVVYIR